MGGLPRPAGRPAIVTPPATPLRILMLAPEPFFEPRGTPFSEFHRIKALVEDGHHVDLVTYPIGRDVDLPNLRIIRTWRPPFVQQGADRPVGRQGPAGRAPDADDPPGGAVRRTPVRRHPLARGDGRPRRVARPPARHPASLRHALEPAAATRQLPVLALEAAALGIREGRRLHGARVAGGDHHLPGVAGHRARDGRRRPRRAHRERHGR